MSAQCEAHADGYLKRELMNANMTVGWKQETVNYEIIFGWSKSQSDGYMKKLLTF